jgi:tetratricopeptide (TPR) repeat protein
MDAEDRIKRAIKLFNEAYRSQMEGDLEEAVGLYKRSIENYPTAEAHTFLGWAYSFQGDYEAAIEECKRAINIDADFGNPYNDIGSYLITLGRPDDAIPWLEQAIRARRYDSYHYPHCNLGRAYMAKGMLNKAQEEFQKALEIEPEYTFAVQAIEAIRQSLN